MGYALGFSQYIPVQKIKKPHGAIHAAREAACRYFDAAGADADAGADASGAEAAGAGAAGADAAGAEASGAAGVEAADADAGAEASWLAPASPCMSTLSPPLMMTNSASSAKAMNAAKIFHMVYLRNQKRVADEKNAG
jgi:hypothetical protein